MTTWKTPASSSIGLRNTCRLYCVMFNCFIHQYPWQRLHAGA
jgi:hypothetical protein